MSQLMDYAEFIACEIGPRPASTPQEEETALFITEQFQKEAGFPAAIEEFTSSSNFTEVRAVCCLVTFLSTLIALFVSAFSIPAFILAVVAAVIYVLEALGKPVLSSKLARGASQNVVAKYQPNPEGTQASVGRGRAHKILLVAHYDSGRAVPGIVRKFESLGLPLGMACMVAMVASAVLLLFHIFLANASGFGGLLLGLLLVICMIIVALPVAKAIMLRVSPYNEGANNNASGTAALIEVARRISRGSLSEADLADLSEGVLLHGEEAAWESGYIPEGAEFVYEAVIPEEEPIPEAPVMQPPATEDRILSAKAAIAALTGTPVENKIYGSVADNLVGARVEGEYPQDPYYEEGQQTEAYADDRAAADQPRENVGAGVWATGSVASNVPSDWDYSHEELDSVQTTFENAPDWFLAAQQKAKRTDTDDSTIHRSRYTEAIEAAEHEAAERERARQEELFAAQRREQEERERLAREAAIAAQEAAEQAREEALREEAERAAMDQTVLEDAEQPRFEVTSSVVEGAARENQPHMDAVGRIAADEEAPDYPRESQEAVRGESTGMAVETLEQKPQPTTQAAQLTQAMPTTPSFAVAQGATEVIPIDKGKSDAQDQVLDGRLQAREHTPGAENVPAQAALEPRPSVPEPEPIPVVQPIAEQENPYTEDALFENNFDYEEDVPARTTRRRIDSLPAIEPEKKQVPETKSPSRSGIFRKLRADIPSLSGIIRMQRAGRDVSEDAQRERQKKVAGVPNISANSAGNNAGASQAKGSKGAAATRRSGKGELEGTPQEWLNVGEDFDARTVGRERGSWESFRDEGDASASPAPEANPTGKQKWEGGAFSRVNLGHVSTRSGESESADEPDVLVETEEQRQLTGEIEQIYHFRNPFYDTEIWFVALGSDTADHDGIKAFLAQHEGELRGSLLVEVESLGAGRLCLASEEGLFQTVHTSSRMKRYTRNATAATGITLGDVRLNCSDSIASIAQKAGLQAMHIMGVEKGEIAFKGNAEDVIENIDEDIFEENVDYLMELLKLGKTVSPIV